MTPSTPLRAGAIDIEPAALALENRSALEILQWASAQFAPRLTFATGFGLEGVVLIDLIGRHDLPIDLFTLDTGLLFPETYDLWRRLESKYDLTIRAVKPEHTVEQQAGREGVALWLRNPDRCCELRKLQPLRRALAGFDAWVTAVRRDQTPDRATARVVEHDAKFGLVKINPLVRWTSAEIRAYVKQNDVPFNPLHEKGYPSIGCLPCTSPVKPGEDPRAGRWRGREKTECGLHSEGKELEMAEHLYPLFLKLRGKSVVVVGGGAIASSRIPALLRVEADVTVIAPEVRPEISGVNILRRAFEASDLDGAWLAIAAATPDVNRRVFDAGQARRIFVNSIDDPETASAYGGGVFHREGLTVAISTEGQAPALAGLLREGIESLVPEDYDAWIRTAREQRAAWKGQRIPMANRRPKLLEALNQLYEVKL